MFNSLRLRLATTPPLEPTLWNTMPSVNKGSKVLVSGANGYLAMWVVRTLLERGFTVRGTVRSESKGKVMIEYFKSLGYDDDKFEVVVVDDIVKVGTNWMPFWPIPLTWSWIYKEGAFDEAVKGVDAIEHTASPFDLNNKEPEGAQKISLWFVLVIVVHIFKQSMSLELINPAVQGTLGMLKSALKNGYAYLNIYMQYLYWLFLLHKISSATYCYNILMRISFVTTFKAYCI